MFRVALLVWVRLAMFRVYDEPLPLPLKSLSVHFVLAAGQGDGAEVLALDPLAVGDVEGAAGQVERGGAS